MTRRIPALLLLAAAVAVVAARRRPAQGGIVTQTGALLDEDGCSLIVPMTFLDSRNSATIRYGG